MSILVCEDNSMIIRAIEYKLLQDGFNTVLASTGEEAFDALKNSEINLVITDLILPNLTGMELIIKIRQELKMNIPIIVLSKIGSEETIMEAFDNGADDYIVKPFSPNELSVRVKRLIKKSQQ